MTWPVIPKGPRLANGLGVCQWCGRISDVTRDHLLVREERRAWHRAGDNAGTAGMVWACSPCNQYRGNVRLDQWHRFLSSDLGWVYLWYRALAFARIRPNASCTIIEPVHHRCAEWRPCMALRRSVVVVGDGLNVFDWYITGARGDRVAVGKLMKQRGRGRLVASA